MEMMQKMSPFSFFFQMADFFFLYTTPIFMAIMPRPVFKEPIRVSFLVSLHLGDMESIYRAKSWVT